MDARFRIRTREGEELRPKTTEIFAEFVRSGAIRPEDMVFDALTGEWVPAGAHPMVKLFKDPLLSDWDVPSLKLVEPAQVSPEEEAQAFIRKMEEERASNPDEPALSREIALVTEETSPSKVTPEVAAAEAPPTLEPAPRRREPAPGRELVSQVALINAEPDEERRSWGQVGLLGLATALSVAALAVFAAVLRPSPRVGDHMADLAETAAVAPRPAHPLNDTEEAVREAAYAHFLDALDGLRGGLDVGAVPGDWLTGKYLADAAAYPEVRTYWQHYLSYVEQARAQEAGLYREAYLEALDQAGVQGPVRSLRLATAVGDFDADTATRGRHYARAWELAAAALALHDTLVRLAGRIRYEPARGGRISADPVIEATGADDDAQARLDAALDRVLDALQADGAALEPDGVPGWLAAGLRTPGGGGTSTP